MRFEWRSALAFFALALALAWVISVVPTAVLPSAWLVRLVSFILLGGLAWLVIALQGTRGPTSAAFGASVAGVAWLIYLAPSSWLGAIGLQDQLGANAGSALSPQLFVVTGLGSLLMLLLLAGWAWRDGRWRWLPILVGAEIVLTAAGLLFLRFAAMDASSWSSTTIWMVLLGWMIALRGLLAWVVVVLVVGFARRFSTTSQLRPAE